MKTCSECNWRIICKQPKNKICDDFSYECSECESEAIVMYKDEPYCEDCILRELNIKTWTAKHYMYDGEYLGNDNENSLDYIFSDFKDVKVIEEE